VRAILCCNDKVVQTKAATHDRRHASPLRRQLQQEKPSKCASLGSVPAACAAGGGWRHRLQPRP
jgi:hypothetical protein